MKALFTYVQDMEVEVAVLSPEVEENVVDASEPQNPDAELYIGEGGGWALKGIKRNENGKWLGEGETT